MLEETVYLFVLIYLQEFNGLNLNIVDMVSTSFCKALKNKYKCRVSQFSQKLYFMLCMPYFRSKRSHQY